MYDGSVYCLNDSDVRRKPTWGEYSISFSIWPANNLPHFFQSQLFHQHKHWSNFICEPVDKVQISGWRSAVVLIIKWVFKSCDYWKTNISTKKALYLDCIPSQIQYSSNKCIIFSLVYFVVVAKFAKDTDGKLR